MACSKDKGIQATVPDTGNLDSVVFRVRVRNRDSSYTKDLDRHLYSLFSLFFFYLLLDSYINILFIHTIFWTLPYGTV